MTDSTGAIECGVEAMPAQYTTDATGTVENDRADDSRTKTDEKGEEPNMGGGGEHNILEDGDWEIDEGNNFIDNDCSQDGDGDLFGSGSESQSQKDEAEVTQADEQTLPDPQDDEAEASESTPDPSTLRITFVVHPHLRAFNHICRVEDTVETIKTAAMMALNEDEPVRNGSIVLRLQDGTVLDDCQIISACGMTNDSSIQILLGAATNKSASAGSDEQMTATAAIYDEPNTHKVTIERSSKKKPFIGGFRDKRTDIVYHHAACQTAAKPKPPSDIVKAHRDAQTVFEITEGSQTSTESATQMKKDGIYVSDSKDRILTPGPYRTADEWEKMMKENTMVVQRFMRGYLSRKRFQRLANNQKRIEQVKEDIAQKKADYRKILLEEERRRRTQPRTRSDFEELYNDVQRWYQFQKSKIDQCQTSVAEQKAALADLLEHETSLIANIDRLKVSAAGDIRDTKVRKTLNLMSSPKKWVMKNGKITEVYTQSIARARDLRDAYESLEMHYQTLDERLDVLLQIKHIVQEQPSQVTSEMCDLIDREADLLMRSRSRESLAGLRKRISNLFLDYLQDPAINAEAERFHNVPLGVNPTLHAAQKRVKETLKEIGLQYKSAVGTMANIRTCREMLQRMGYKESRVTNNKGYLLYKDVDIHYLVNTIWNGQSAISGWPKLQDLTLSRWNLMQDWTPWNCIVLTNEEAIAHESLSSLKDAYSAQFIHKIEQKHMVAKLHFDKQKKISANMVLPPPPLPPVKKTLTA